MCNIICVGSQNRGEQLALPPSPALYSTTDIWMICPYQPLCSTACMGLFDSFGFDLSYKFLK